MQPISSSRSYASCPGFSRHRSKTVISWVTQEYLSTIGWIIYFENLVTCSWLLWCIMQLSCLLGFLICAYNTQYEPNLISNTISQFQLQYDWILDIWQLNSVYWILSESVSEKVNPKTTILEEVIFNMKSKRFHSWKLKTKFTLKSTISHENRRYIPSTEDTF